MLYGAFALMLWLVVWWGWNIVRSILSRSCVCCSRCAGHSHRLCGGGALLRWCPPVKEGFISSVFSGVCLMPVRGGPVGKLMLDPTEGLRVHGVDIGACWEVGAVSSWGCLDWLAHLDHVSFSGRLSEWGSNWCLDRGHLGSAQLSSRLGKVWPSAPIHPRMKGITS